MNPTCAGEAGDVEAIAPTVRDLRPFGGAAVVAEVLTGADRDAVDEPGRERPELAAHGRRGRLVEQREPLLDVAGLDERSSFAHQRQRVRVAIAEAVTELESAVELRDCPGQVTFDEERSDSAHQHQDTVLGGLRLSLEQALGVGEPPVGDGEEPSTHVVVRKLEGEPGRAQPIPARREPAVRTLAEADRLVRTTAPPRRLREELEVGRRQIARVVLVYASYASRQASALRGAAGGLDYVHELGHRHLSSRRGGRPNCSTFRRRFRVRDDPWMPLQNRVTPLSELVADPARGLVYGNRGCLHDDAGRIRRRYNGRRWIACRLEFRGWQRSPLLQPGRFTELFFLDEATAFAAGHRPCALCRREDYVRFGEIWRGAHPGQSRRRRDRRAASRRARRARHARATSHEAALDELPDGTFVVHDGAPQLVLGVACWPGPGRLRVARAATEPTRDGDHAAVGRRSAAEGWEERLVPLFHPSALSGS